jgi:hypothetical protein
MTSLPKLLLWFAATALLSLGAYVLWNRSDYDPMSHETELQKHSDSVLAQIREEHRATGYSFDIYHGDYPRLVVEGPETEDAAREIEESLIRSLQSAKMIPAAIEYVIRIPDADISAGDPNLKSVRSTMITQQDAQQGVPPNGP